MTYEELLIEVFGERNKEENKILRAKQRFFKYKSERVVRWLKDIIRHDPKKFYDLLIKGKSTKDHVIFGELCIRVNKYNEAIKCYEQIIKDNTPIPKYMPRSKIEKPNPLHLGINDPGVLKNNHVGEVRDAHVQACEGLSFCYEIMRDYNKAKKGREETMRAIEVRDKRDDY